MVRAFETFCNHLRNLNIKKIIFRIKIIKNYYCLPFLLDSLTQILRKSSSESLETEEIGDAIFAMLDEIFSFKSRLKTLM